MTPLNNAEEAGAVVLNAFFDEIYKVAGVNPLKWFMGAAPKAGYEAGVAVKKGTEAAKATLEAAAKEERLQGIATEQLGNLQSMRDGMPVSGHTKTIKSVEKESKTTKDYALAATALGVGGLGFGYHQYNKNNQNNQ